MARTATAVPMKRTTKASLAGVRGKGGGVIPGGGSMAQGGAPELPPQLDHSGAPPGLPPLQLDRGVQAAMLQHCLSCALTTWALG